MAAVPERSTYREQFAEIDKATRYDSEEYGARSWSTLLWGLEQTVLQCLLDDPQFVPRREAYLDFACGTGRVTEFIAPRFSRARGIDISESMLTRARARVPSARFFTGNVMATPDLLEGAFDLVTAFRFILNADEEDRETALRWIRSRMHDDSSRVVVNNHSNLLSHKALPYAWRQLRHKGRRVTGNVLRHGRVVDLATAAGFRVESVMGVGYLGGTFLRVIEFDRMTAMQKRLASVGWLQSIAEDQIYVLAPV